MYNIVERFTPEELGFSEKKRPKYFTKSGMPSFVPVSVNNRHKVGIFCIKKGHKIYMHDHHNMAVILKVLCGKIQYRSVDIVNPKFRNLNWA